METPEYNLSLHEALKIVMDGGAVKGNDFASGIFMKVDSTGQLVIVDANRFYEQSHIVSIVALSRQKFRSLTVMTKKSLSV